MSPMHLNGENCQNVIGREKVYGNGQVDCRFMILKKKMDPRGRSAPTRGNIHIYYHYIQRSSSLKPLGQSKPNFIWIILRKGERKFI